MNARATSDPAANVTTPRPILVAGIGNIFLGDDAFGVEVAQQLLRHPLPERVRVVDFGIRSYDLAYALMEDYTAAILLDAVQRGRPPGTVYLMELDWNAWEQLAAEAGQVMNGHSLHPAQVLQLVQAWGGRPMPLYLVGCEPAVLETEDGAMGLSAPVAPAVAEAIQLVTDLIDRLLAPESEVGKPCTNSAS